MVKAVLSLSFVLLLAVFAPLVSAQQFGTPEFLRVGTFPQQVTAGDLNGDGKLDLLVADYAQGGIAILFGNGDGTFQPAQHLFVGHRMFSVAIADLNGDGIADFLALETVGAPQAKLVAFLGKGGGAFRFSASYALAGVLTYVAIGDFNGDGHPDAAIAHYSSDMNGRLPGYVSVLLGKGDGTFGKSVQYNGGTKPYSIAVGDVDQDGHQDFVVANLHTDFSTLNSVFVLLNNGDGTFRNGSIYQTGVESPGVTMGDLNHDGKLDMVISSAFDQGIYVLLGNGDGSFQAPVLYRTDSHSAGPYASVIADFNLDGKPDVATANYQGYTDLFYGNGDGTLQPVLALTTIGDAGAISLVAGDVNGDGHPDLAIAQMNVGYVAVVTNAQ